MSRFAGMSQRLRRPGLTGWASIATIAASVVAVLAFVVPDGEESEEKRQSKEAFAQVALERWHSGDFDGYWRLWHPATQEQIPLAEYVSCEESLPLPSAVELKPVGPGSVAIDQEGISEKIAPTVVFQAKLATREAPPFPEVVPVLRVDGEYHVVLQQGEYEAWTEGDCSDVLDFDTQPGEEPGGTADESQLPGDIATP